MNERNHSQDAHLWDPAAAPDPEVAAVESRLSALRFDPATRPLTLPAPGPMALPAQVAPKRPRRFWMASLAAAAVVLLAVGGTALWRWTWPERRPWTMTVQTGALEPRIDRLEVGQPFVAGADTQAIVSAARIGTISVAPGSNLTLRATASTRHRLVLARGTIDVRVWAPTGWLGVQTPAGEVIDLGCVFRLGVGDDGTTRVSVESGWVQLVNFDGEMLIPAGASSEMRVDSAPLVPLYDAASPRFREGVRRVELALRADAAAPIDLAFIGDATARDVITLLVLSRALPADARRQVLTRARDLVAPPRGVTVESIVAGNDNDLWVWYGALDLPSPKAWWLNWRDALR